MSLGCSLGFSSRSVQGLIYVVVEGLVQRSVYGLVHGLFLSLIVGIV